MKNKFNIGDNVRQIGDHTTFGEVKLVAMRIDGTIFYQIGKIDINYPEHQLELIPEVKKLYAYKYTSIKKQKDGTPTPIYWFEKVLLNEEEFIAVGKYQRAPEYDMEFKDV